MQPYFYAKSKNKQVVIWAPAGLPLATIFGEESQEPLMAKIAAQADEDPATQQDPYPKEYEVTCLQHLGGDEWCITLAKKTQPDRHLNLHFHSPADTPNQELWIPD